MYHNLWARAGGAGLVLALYAGMAFAEPQHGIAMYGDPQLTSDFQHLPYANPDAPKGGRIATGETGSFSSLNPYLASGSPPWQLRFMLDEGLMARNWNEPFSLYGLMAETIETGPNREWVEFTLREGITFSDGTPVTVEDVIWSYETIGEEGHPRYRGVWDKVESLEQIGPRTIRFTFNEDNPELALVIGLRPILKKAQFEGMAFSEAEDILPITASAYRIGEFELGRFFELERNQDYWAADLPIRRGTMNLDIIRTEYFGDSAVTFEAFKAGVLNSQREFNAETWETQYDFPRLTNGEVVKSVIPHERPSGMTGFVMNSRKPPFDDWRVRDAMLHAFNFEYVNEVMTGAAQPRITSYFSNSLLGMESGPASGRVAELLAPYSEELLPGALEGYALPQTDGSERNRAGLRTATERLAEAGYSVEEGVMVGPDGPLTFEIVLKQGDNENRAIIDIFVNALQRLGVRPIVTTIDDAQFTERTRNFDFDMTTYRVGLSLSPGTEQRGYWGADVADQPGGRNLMGMKSAAADAMVEAILQSESRDDFLAATRALDRVLTSGRYVLPIYQWNISRIAHAKELRYPESLPIYGDWVGWQPDVWWWEE